MVKPIEDNKDQTIKILPGTPQMEAYLRSGYPEMTVEKAKTIIRERKENPAMWPYEMLERAEAFLAAYNSSPQVVSERKPWKRDRRE